MCESARGYCAVAGACVRVRVATECVSVHGYCAVAGACVRVRVATESARGYCAVVSACHECECEVLWLLRVRCR